MPIQRLISGIHRFQGQTFRQRQELFEKLARGQAPDTLFITCCDSRIDPNLMTSALPGQLFTMRNVGNIVPPHGVSNGGELPAIEYAILGLKVTDIIVCGHSHCGAIQAMLDPSKLLDLPQVAAWLEHAEGARRILFDRYLNLTPEERVEVTIQENVLVQLENLRTHPIVAKKIDDKQLKLHGWVYMIETGEINSYDPNEEQFQPVGDDRMLAALLSGLRPR